MQKGDIRTMQMLVLRLAIVCMACVTHAWKPRLRGGLFKKDKFTKIPEFTDEFRGRFNHSKWDDHNKRWLGRQPGLFVKSNVKQRRGLLMLRGKWERNKKVFRGKPKGYEKYTTAFVQSKKRARFGYFEVRVKPSNSRMSSSFWGSLDKPNRWTEIDVFELGGGAIFEGIDHRSRINMNLHVFRDHSRGIRRDKNEIHRPSHYQHHAHLRSRYHVYGLDWARRHITWTFNGRAIRRDRNRYWRQAFPMKFDVETMPYFFGLPSRKTLPSQYRIKYIRAWKREKRKRRKRKNSNRQLQLESNGFLPLVGGDISSLFSNNGLPIVNGGGLASVITDTPQTDKPGIENDTDEEDDNDGRDVDEDDDGDDGSLEDVADLGIEVPDDDVDDEAVTEVEDEDGRETPVRKDGLQRAATSPNEQVYLPVLAPGGKLWTDVINMVNERMDDVLGTTLTA